MKVRNGFVSNSSSSSFIIKKSSLTESQLQIVLDFLDRRKRCFETELQENTEKYLIGRVEAHNIADDSDWIDEISKDDAIYDNDTAANLLDAMLIAFGLGTKDYCIRYEEHVGPEDLKEE